MPVMDTPEGPVKAPVVDILSVSLPPLPFKVSKPVNVTPVLNGALNVSFPAVPTKVSGPVVSV